MSPRTLAALAAFVFAGTLTAPLAAQTTPNPNIQAPALAPVKTLTVPPVVERKLANGLRVLIVEQHELPLVDLFVVVRSGAEADPKGKGGLATLAANMLDEGANGRTSLQIAEQISYLGISLSTGAAFDQSRVSLHAPIAQLDSGLALAADVTLRPSFPATDFERIKKERLTQLLQLQDRGPAIADAAYAFELFGADHPYGHSQVGDEASVTSLTRDDVVSYYQTYYRPNNSTIVVVGDVRPDDVQRRLERWFGSWKPGTVPATSFPAPPAEPSTTVYLIDKPGAAQSSVRIGNLGAPRATPDYFPLIVMNTVLGGAFTSRLNQNLRETHGYTYGAFSNFDMRRAAGPFVANSEVVTEKSDSALIEALKEIKGVREQIPVPELEKAKSYIQLGLPAEFETTTGIAARLVPMALYDLPLDYYGSFSRNVTAVTQADAQRVAQRYIRPDNLQIVVVGDLQKIEAGIRALGMKTEQRDLTGRPIHP